jgi:hypothetical protein
MDAVALEERRNSQLLLPSLYQDSRLGYDGVSSGGLFTPRLVQWQIGFTDDVLLMQLPEALQSAGR